MFIATCYAVEDLDCLMDKDYAQLFYYGFCQACFYVTLFLYFLMFNFHIHVSFSIRQTFVLALVGLYTLSYMLLLSFKSHILFSSRQKYVFTLAVLYTMSYLYIHAIDFAVDQLLVFLHVSIRV